MDTTLNFTEKPSLGKAYFNVFTPGRHKFSGHENIPTLTANLPNITEKPETIQAYREACGVGNDGNHPVLYPHVLTSAMHIHLLTDKRFPASALGAVHSRIHIIQHRPIKETETVDLQCAISASRTLKAGLETDITTTLRADDACIWESVSSYIFRGKQFGTAGDPHPLSQFDELGDPTLEAEWHVPANMGKRYAKITGDYNPIHVSKFLAKLFGFKRDIVHGMWCLCRCLAHIQDFSYDQPVRLDAAFKGPVFMDSDCTMKGHEIDSGFMFNLFNQNNPRPSIVSVMRAATENESLISND